MRMGWEGEGWGRGPHEMTLSLPPSHLLVNWRLQFEAFLVPRVVVINVGEAPKSLEPFHPVPRQVHREALAGLPDREGGEKPRAVQDVGGGVREVSHGHVAEGLVHPVGGVPTYGVCDGGDGEE